MAQETLSSVDPFPEPAETTPLLSEQVDDPADENGGSGGEPASERSTEALTQTRAPVTIAILTFISLFCAVTSAALNITARVRNPNSGDCELYYSTNEASMTLLNVTVIIAVLSSFNLMWQYGHGSTILGLNFFVDLGATIFALICGNVLFREASNESSHCRYTPDGYECRVCNTPTRLLLLLSSGFGIALGLIHLVLLLTRLVTIPWPKFSRMSWVLPLGSISVGVEFSIRALRQERSSELRAARGETH